MHTINTWWLRIITLLVGAAAAASATHWGLKLTSSASTSPHFSAIAPSTIQIDPKVIARLLGGGQTAASTPPIDSGAGKFKLTGVVAGPSQGGYALIAIEGKPPRPYQVGAQVDEHWILKSVTPRSAALAPAKDAPATLTLDLPKL